MKSKHILLSALLLSAMMLTACSGKPNKLELNDGVVVSGEAYVPDETKVMLHFATFQRTNTASAEKRMAEADTQFICCDDAGNVTNSFSVNREIFNRPIMRLNSVTTLGFLDFNLNCSSDGITYVDDSTYLDLPQWTGLGSDVTGYIEETDTAYYLYNMGTGAIDGQYTTILRFVNSQTSYDVVMPYPIIYAAYDRVLDQFIYRVSNHSDDFLFGFIDYDDVTGRYRYNEPLNSIPLGSMLEKHGDHAYDGYRILFDDNIVYEILTVPVNENVLNDLELSTDYLERTEHRWGVLLLRTFNFNDNTYSLEYLTTEPFEGDPYYGFYMSGTQQMPVTAVNGNLYIFTRDEKLGVYDPQTGFVQYDISFDSTEALSPYDLFGSDSQGGPTLGDRSPIKICDNGDLYTAHAYSDGTIKIHKYNFSEQRFELYWTSASGVLDELNKKSLQFVSFELVN